MRRNAVGNRALVALLGLSLVVLTTILLNHLSRVRNDQIWLNEYRTVEEIIVSLRDRRPRGCGEQDWKNAVDRVWAGFSNGCHNPSTTTAGSIRSLGMDIEELIRTSYITAELLRKVWLRIGETSPAAARLIDSHQADFEEYMEFCEGEHHGNITGPGNIMRSHHGA